MAKAKDDYSIEVHYPLTEEGMQDIRKRTGAAYHYFIKEYILSLPITGQEKNGLYSKVCGCLAGKRRDML
jgi:hypothetical protein